MKEAIKKIYIEDHVLFFLHDKTSGMTDSNLIPINNIESSPVEIIEFIESQKHEKHRYYVTHNHPEKYFEEFIHHFKIIEAAGGIVTNGSGNYLMIFRLGKWDLPKGKIEKGETPSEAAVREVEEECGISGLKVQKPVSDTCHTYRLNGRLIVKLTHWYHITCKDSSLPKPQLEEDITKAEWVNEKQLKECMRNTYNSVLEVVNKATGLGLN